MGFILDTFGLIALAGSIVSVLLIALGDIILS